MGDPLFTGTCPALVTPFTSEGRINFPKLEELIERAIQADVDALCVCGTTGESSTLSTQEQGEVIACAVTTVAGRVKVVAGAGSNDSATARLRSRQAEQAGADGLLHVTPYYNKCSQEGLIKHYSHIAAGTDLPIILYNVPSRTGVCFAAETYHTLSQLPNIHGIKEASGNLSLVTHTRQLCGEDFPIWSGNDEQVVPLMALGAKGVISVAANLIPQQMTALSHLCLSGDYQQAAQLQIRLLPLLESMFVEVNPIPIKTALNLIGLEVGGFRLPLCQPQVETVDLLRQVMEEQGL